MEDALAAEAPRLASMFETFSLLTRYERPVGIEALASAALTSRDSRGSARPFRPRVAAIAALVALVFVLAACLAIGAQPRPVVRPCLAATSAGLTGFTLSRGPGCAAYPAAKKK